MFKEDRDETLESIADALKLENFISGHAGALYIIRDTDDVRVPIVTRQRTFHDKLRALWREHKDPKTFCDKLLEHVKTHVWNGTLKKVDEDLLNLRVPFVDSKRKPLKIKHDKDRTGAPLEKPRIEVVKTLEQLGRFQAKNHKALMEKLKELIGDL